MTDIEQKKIFSKNLNFYLSKANKTQKEVAEYLFCDQSLYSKYERGQRDVPVGIIIKLAKLYNTSTDYILGLTDIKTPYG